MMAMGLVIPAWVIATIACGFVLVGVLFYLAIRKR